MIDIIRPTFDPKNPHSAVENMMLMARECDGELLAFVHDDVDILDDGWYRTIEVMMDAFPHWGMVGFGGATGLGTDDLYKTRYDLRQLARINFMSNMTDAERHGTRTFNPHRVAVLDGFCQIIRRKAYISVGGWEKVLDMGITFHMYDAAMACLMRRHDWETWLVPIRCIHYGGRTSTSPQYHDWLLSQGVLGDLEVHQKAHRVIYNQFGDVLPIRV